MGGEIDAIQAMSIMTDCCNACKIRDCHGSVKGVAYTRASIHAGVMRRRSEMRPAFPEAVGETKRSLLLASAEWDPAFSSRM